MSSDAKWCVTPRNLANSPGREARRPGYELAHALRGGGFGEERAFEQGVAEARQVRRGAHDRAGRPALLRFQGVTSRPAAWS